MSDIILKVNPINFQKYSLKTSQFFGSFLFYNMAATKKFAYMCVMRIILKPMKAKCKSFILNRKSLSVSLFFVYFKRNYSPTVENRQLSNWQTTCTTVFQKIRERNASACLLADPVSSLIIIAKQDYFYQIHCIEENFPATKHKALLLT